MNTQEYIQNFRKNKENSKLAFEAAVKKYSVAGMPLIECRDAKLLNGRYSNMKLSDIFIFDPNYLTYLINHDKVSEDLKEIAKEVIKNQSFDEDSVSRRIALE